MPRKKQIVQKQRRRKVYQADQPSGASRIKPRGFFRVFTNYRLFAIIGAIGLGGGFLVSAIVGSTSSGSTNDGSVRTGEITRETPAPNETVTGDNVRTVKQYPGAPAMVIDPTKTYTAVIRTAKGDVRVELNAKDAPQTVNNFVFLARDKFYDGVSFFRVVADDEGTLHFAQAGDPTGTGSGGPGYELPFEKTDDPVPEGVLVMARPNDAGSQNNGSQFFITLQDEPTLEGEVTVFGRVIEGLGVFDEFSQRDTLVQREAPEPEIIESIEILES